MALLKVNIQSFFNRVLTLSEAYSMLVLPYLKRG